MAMNDLTAKVKGMIEAKNTRFKIERLKEKKIEWEQKPDWEPRKAGRLATINKLLNEATVWAIWISSTRKKTYCTSRYDTIERHAYIERKTC